MRCNDFITPRYVLASRNALDLSATVTCYMLPFEIYASKGPERDDVRCLDVPVAAAPREGSKGAPEEGAQVGERGGGQRPAHKRVGVCICV
jgi:hypothetical protein